uniref:Chromo domain-containing protein n=1 Tax=Elaeophora elaphi TaxID=1147741 RepID=A0A0R3S2K9_9BILA
MANVSGIGTVMNDEAKLAQLDTKSRIIGETYAVEKIVGIKTNETGEKLYKVRWKGFSESEDTWEPYENLTDGCDRLIVEYEVSEKLKNDGNGKHLQPSGVQSLFQEGSVERNSRHPNAVRWEYETVEVLTPDEWNRFGDVENRELGGLYIPDRIPTETEKVYNEFAFSLPELLCNLAPDVGRVTRNKLKAVMKTENSPINDTLSSDLGKKQSARGRRRGGKRSRTSVDMKKAIDDEQRSVIKDESKILASSSKAEDAISPANSEMRPASAEFFDETPNLVVDEVELISDEERSNSVYESTSTSHRSRSRGRGLARGNRGKRTIGSRGAVVVDTNELSDRNSRLVKCRKRKTSANTDAVIEKRVSTTEGTSERDELVNNIAHVLRADDESDEPDVSALEMLILETPELPIPMTNAEISAIEIATIRRHQQNREKPLQTFEQFRSAVLSNQLSSVRWTGRCVPERRGFDFNQKYRGKTVAIELCERPCGPAHETDDMLRQIVRDGARLDIPDDTRGRIPLHFAISCEFWCRVKTLLHLRSPVNTEDKDKKTPLQLAMLTSRAPNFEVRKTIYLLLEYGADVNEVIKRMAPLRNRYLSNLVDHQQRLSEAFDEARMKTLV